MESFFSGRNNSKWPHPPKKLYETACLLTLSLFRLEVQCCPREDSKAYRQRSIYLGTSLVVLWIRIHLPMQGTGVPSLIWKDSTCLGATKLVGHNYRANVLQLLKPERLEPVLYKISYCLVAAATAAKSLQSCPTLCDPIDSSPPGSAIPGILQARTLEWVAISFSNACMKVKSESESEVAQSCPTLSDPMDCSQAGSSVHGSFQARVLEWVAVAFSCLAAKLYPTLLRHYGL